MLRHRGRPALLALVALAVGTLARADEPQRTRVVIRGTGDNVSIERIPAAARRRPLPQAASSVISEAARLAAARSGDDAVIAYLRSHQRDLPQVVEASDVRLLRKSGAGSAVIAYLETVAAVDLGELGEGRDGSQQPVAPAQEGLSLAANEYPNDPFYGGYGASYAPLRPSFRHHTRFPRQPMVRHPIPTPFSSHGSQRVGRRPGQ